MENTRRKRKIAEELRQAKVQFSKGVGEGLEIGRERGERKEYSMKYRPVGLILIPGRT